MRSADPHLHQEGSPEPCPDDVEAFIARIYKSGHELPPGSFGSWALRQFRSALPFDAARWETFSATSSNSQTLGSTGIRADFSGDMTHELIVRPITDQALANLDSVISLDQIVPSSFFAGATIEERSRKNQIFTTILSSAYFDEHSGLYATLTLFRMDRARAFSESERNTVKRIGHHLMQARSHAALLAVADPLTIVPASSVMALVRPGGQYEYASSSFLELIHRHFPESAATELPRPFFECGRQSITHGLCIRSYSADDMTCVHAWPERLLDRLTPREQQVVNAVVKGLSFRRAGAQIGVSTSCAANHFYRVCAKVGVTSRSELIDRIHRGTDSSGIYSGNA